MTVSLYHTNFHQGMRTYLFPQQKEGLVWVRKQPAAFLSSGLDSLRFTS